MRISDWSSDVCSSDLVRRRCASVRERRAWRSSDHNRAIRHFLPRPRCRCGYPPESEGAGEALSKEGSRSPDFPHRGALQSPSHRSEEHTSELQSLMSTSNAAFCLKNKKKKIRK